MLDRWTLPGCSVLLAPIITLMLLVPTVELLDAKGGSASRQLRLTWRPPASYCYQHPRNWSACASDHLIYPPSTAEALYARRYMCLHEPFCWKQLNWQHNNPPRWRCPRTKNLRFYDMSYHWGAMASAATTIEQTLNNYSGSSHEVYLCNYKDISDLTRHYHRHFKSCPRKVGLEETWQTPFSWERFHDNIRNYETDPHFAAADAQIFAFGSSMWEHWMGNNKTLILALWHRVNQYRCSPANSQRTFHRVRELASAFSKRHIIGAMILYDVEYLRHYTGVNPILLPATLLGALGHLVWTPLSKTRFLWNTFRPVPEILRNDTQFEFVPMGVPSPHTFKELAGHAGVVVEAYSITNAKVVEAYAMAIPIFAPSLAFAQNMITDRTATYDPYCPELRDTDLRPHASTPYKYSPNVRMDTDGASVREDVLFWNRFAEIYNWPCIEYYTGWGHLLELLQTANTTEMSACMQQANKWRHFEEVQNWCWVSRYISKQHHQPEKPHAVLQHKSTVRNASKPSH